jgi:hypothetical protein
MVRPADKTWYTNDLRQLKRKMLRSFKKAKQSRDSADWEKFTKIRTDYQKKVLKAKADDTEEKYRFLSSECFINPKKWWSILKHVYKNSDNADSIPPIETDVHIITDDLEKAEAFNDFFLKASFLDDTEATLPENIRVFDDGTGLSNINITMQDVVDQVKCLDCSKSYGPDGISPVFIKEGGETMHRVLNRFFVLSLEKARVPQAFKKANVIPIHKKELKTLIPNYRPISLLNIMSKLLEKIVFKYVYNFFKENFVLSVFQSGFQEGKSTITQLLEIYHKFCKAVEENKEIRVPFLIYQKLLIKFGTKVYYLN